MDALPNDVIHCLLKLVYHAEAALEDGDAEGYEDFTAKVDALAAALLELIDMGAECATMACHCHNIKEGEDYDEHDDDCPCLAYEKAEAAVDRLKGE